MDKRTVEKHAREMAADFGLINLTRAELCQRAGIPEGSFHHVVGSTFVDFVEGLKISEPFGGSELVARSRAIPALRAGNILAAAVKVSIEIGYDHITRAQVAEAAGASPALVTKYFGNMENLRHKIMVEAVYHRVLPVIAQGLAAADTVARGAPAELKAKAAKTLTT